jgi:predicted ATP-grasp superfamily ATP-dependent carboligase
MRQVLTIVGSSARAAAVSAARSGFIVYAADLFADVDLGRVARWATPVDDYPAGLGDIIRGTQQGPWLYTGALENHPDLIDAWASQRPLWGNSGEVVRRVRDPLALAATLAEVGLQAPAVTTRSDRVPTDGSWLAKPFKSAGGQRISRWRRSEGADIDEYESNPSSWYFQQEIEGEPHSAVYVMAGGHAVLLGVTEQKIGSQDFASKDFRYRGSVGPIDLLPREKDVVLQIGEVLADAFSLTGFVGVDFVLNSEGVWTVEVNPRLTASVEVIERACGLAAVHLHANACEHGALPIAAAIAGSQFAGKEIVFAPERVRFSPSAQAGAFETSDEILPSWLADIPRADTFIDAGWPIATVLATGNSLAAVRADLQRKATMLLQLCTAPR